MSREEFSTDSLDFSDVRPYGEDSQHPRVDGARVYNITRDGELISFRGHTDSDGDIIIDIEPEPVKVIAPVDTRLRLLDEAGFNFQKTLNLLMPYIDEKLENK